MKSRMWLALLIPIVGLFLVDFVFVKADATVLEAQAASVSSVGAWEKGTILAKGADEGKVGEVTEEAEPTFGGLGQPCAGPMGRSSGKPVAECHPQPESDDLVDVIVELELQPALAYRATTYGRLEKRLSGNEVQDVRSYANQVREAQQRVKRLASAQKLQLSVKQSYDGIYNGLAAQIRWGDRERLAKLPGVKAIHQDGVVHGVLEESVPLIRADKVWRELGATGAGVRVGILDSGIDYTHPDLGGCFGAGCKVIGGYDFVNNDADPLDDHGHGTHTAGIVAASGTITGVAPAASLVALKVLDNQNLGAWSDVLAALEYAVDVDGDPGTNDEVADALALILAGAGGSPDDPVALALDNVVRLGIPAVVAAGNTGPLYDTMNTPGGSRLAITVGGSSKQEEMYYYSSRGGNQFLMMKPDVIAPGVEVCSTILDNDYACWNGTSMATPHVAGVVALLRQLHPDWGAVEMKSVLMGSAVDLGFDPFSQGAGRVDAYAAAFAVGGLAPQSLHLGTVDHKVSQWSVTRVMTLTNLYSHTLAYTLTAGNDDWPTGISASVVPSQVVLAPNAMSTVTLELTVDTNLVPDVTAAPHIYEGRLRAESAQGAISAPFVFAKAPQLILHYDEDPWMIMVHNRNGVRLDPPWHPGRDVSLFVPAADTYDVVTVFGSGLKIVVREQVAITQTTELTITQSEATNQVSFVPRDENGSLLEGRYWWRVIRFQDSDSWNGVGWHVSDPNFYSNLSSDYRIEWSEGGAYHRSGGVPNNASQYFFKQHQIGLSGPLTLTNNPAELQPVKLKYHTAPSEALYSMPFSVQMSEPTDRWLAYPPSDTVPISSPFMQTLYFDPPGSYPYVFGYEQLRGFPQSAWSYDLETFRTPFLRMSEGGELEGVRWEVLTPTISMAGRWEIGLTPAWWSGQFSNHSTGVRVEPSLGSDYFLFFDQYDNVLPAHNYPYTLTGATADRPPPPAPPPILGEGSSSPPLVLGEGLGVGAGREVRSFGELLWQQPEIAVTPGVYTLTVAHPAAYYLAEQPVAPQIVATFDTRLADPNPPYFTALRLSANGVLTNVLAHGESAYLDMQLHDDQALASVSAAWQPMGGASWNVLATSQVGDGWRAALPDNIAGGDYVLRVTATDTSGNQVVYTSTPGWRVLPATLGVTSFSVNVQSGWNHISLPLQPAVPYTAERLCDEINNQGGQVVEIDRWHAAGWQGHICDLPFNDFAIEMGSSYFLKSNTTSHWAMEGYRIQQPVSRTLQIGWNSIGLPHTAAYTAESWCDEIISQGVAAVEIDRWDNGGWEGHLCGFTFNNFSIERGKGYFIKSNSASPP